ncbi:MAG: bifunctional phosphopantothenoylcysteine decarboxylase/phosphopantothenate--cysteine ligase CoaBC [Oscillospiraceae bacterium]|nr:bifunctional phosphopantothenoylcysteine decarboxylase/phosphopantothenate--cysteine ligase CoaBC [Oscillospiraceae bacterium]
MNLKDKKILLGITGGIAAYKMANVASALRKAGAEVHVIMTENATQFITPLTFETLTGRKAYIDTFDRVFSWDVKHISLTTNADLFLVAPASANFIAKAANGIADDMLTSTFLAATCHKMIYPAMNTHMYENVATQRNMKQLVEDGMEVVDPAAGFLACGDVGKGRLPEPDSIMEDIVRHFAKNDLLKGVKLLVTAGPTREHLDPVRYITNLSSGKMGYAIAQAAVDCGAEVTLVSGKTNLTPPKGVNFVDITSAEDMYNAVISRADEQDIIIKSAAVADFTPASVADNKIKKSDMADNSLKLDRTKDILKELGARKKDKQVICGFSMETTDLLANSRKKLDSKNADMIVANDLTEQGAGFGVDTNVVTLITRDSAEKLEIMSKQDLALFLVKKCKELLDNK